MFCVASMFEEVPLELVLCFLSLSLEMDDEGLFFGAGIAPKISNNKICDYSVFLNRGVAYHLRQWFPTF